MILSPALLPTRVWEPPVVIAVPALLPMTTLSELLSKASSASYPIATLLSPVELPPEAPKPAL